MSHQRAEDITNDLVGVVCQPSQMASSFIRRQMTEALSRLCRALEISCRAAAHNNLPSVFCPLSSVPGGTQ